jgi:hypothetical protein
MENQQANLQQPISDSDLLLDIDKKSNFTVIVRRQENTKFTAPEENMIDLLFKYHSIRYQKIEYFSEEINIFFGKIPVIYILNDIVENKNIPKFLVDLIFQQENIFTSKVDSLLYILRDIYKISFEYLVYLKVKEKQNSKNSIFDKIRNFFNNVFVYENNMKTIFENFSFFNDNNQFHLSLDEKAKALIEHCYNYFMEIYYSETKRKEKTMDFKKRELLLNVLIYSYIKEEIDNPTITNIFQTNQKINTFKNEIYNFIEYEVKRKNSDIMNNLLLAGFKISDNFLKKIKKEICIKFFKAEKQQDIIEKTVSSNSKQGMITVGIFLFAGLIFYWLSNRKTRTIKQKIFPVFIKDIN